MAFNTAIGRAEYTASAAQTIFTFTFKIYDTSDVKVYLTPVGQTADDTTDILIETTDYTISINGDNGGDVTLTSGAALNDAVTLVRDLPVDRDTEYQQNGDLTAEALNGDQDYQTYLILDGSLKTNERALIIPDSAQDFDTTLPAPGADKMFIYASDGKSINLIDPSNTDFFKEAFIVNSMQALLGVDENTYGSVNVRGYYAINDGGGGLFNWDLTINKSTANAGTIIDPSVSLANQGTGVGNGCWVRQYNEPLNVKWFDTATNAFNYSETSNETISIFEDTEILIPTHYGTLQKAIDLIKTTKEIDLMIESTHVLGSGILCENGEFGNFKLSSQDAIVTVEVAFDGGVIKAVNSRAVVLNCVVNLTGCSSFDSYTVTQSSTGKVNASCGVLNGDRGLYVENASSCFAESAVFTGFVQAGLHVSRTSDCECNYANFSNNSTDTGNAFGAVYASRTSRIHGADLDVTNSGSSAIRAQRLAIVAVPGVDVSGAKGGAFIATLAGKIYSSVSSPTANNIEAEAVIVQAGGLVAFGGSFTFGSTGFAGTAIEVRGAGSALMLDSVTLTGFTGLNIYAVESATVSFAAGVIIGGSTGILAERASRVNARSCNISNVTSNGVFADKAGTIEINDASITGSGSNDIACAKGSWISAINCTTTNGVGTPNTIDTNLSGFNFFDNGDKGMVWA